MTTTQEKANEAGDATPASFMQPLPNATSAVPQASCSPDSTPRIGDHQANATDNVAAKLKAKLDARRAQEEAANKALSNAFGDDIKGLAESLGDTTSVLMDWHRAVDEANDRMDMVALFKALFPAQAIGRNTPTGQMVQCPSHADNGPSLGLQSDKLNNKGRVGTGNCFVCGPVDKITLGSWAFGLDQKTQTNVIAERLATEYGGLVKPQPTVPAPVMPPVAVQQPQTQAQPQPEPTPQASGTTYDWRQVLSLSPANRNGDTTFLWEWCKAIEPDTTPTEFNLFTGLMGLGMVAGNDISAPDFKPLSANFGMCFVAPSGAGKSRATLHMTDMLKKVRPGNKDGTGVHIHGTVFSGQEMIRMLDHREADPSNPKAPPTPVPQCALFEYPELSDIAAGGSIQGNILKAKMHDALDHKSEMQYSSGQMGGKITAVDPFASIVTTTQTKRIRDLLKRDDAASGFMNRFLFLMGTEKKRLARGEVPLDFKSAELKLTAIRMYTGTTRSLEWDEDSGDYWEKVFDTVVEPLQKADTHDILTRLDLNLKRMMLAFAVNERATSIQRHHVEMAEALIPYLVTCYEQVLGALLNTEDREICEWVLEKAWDLEQKARAKGSQFPGPSQADMRRYYGKKGWPDWKVTRALKSLGDAGLILPIESSGLRGGKTNRYYVQR